MVATKHLFWSSGALPRVLVVRSSFKANLVNTCNTVVIEVFHHNFVTFEVKLQSLLGQHLDQLVSRGLTLDKMFSTILLNFFLGADGGTTWQS